ncbi:MAG: hypothetical protein LBQ31_10065 [Bacteroidales bacterium]|jgi:hypothetical protein|nr:hypothetical protein [Bacteroidales bacterium]
MLFDIAKYVFTGVIVAYFFDDIKSEQNNTWLSSWWIVYVTGFMVGFGLLFIAVTVHKKTNKKRKK